MLPIDQLQLIPSQVAVLREIHRAGATTRIDLSKVTGLSAQSLTRITKQLLDDRILVEGERRNNGRGQPAVYLSICPSRFISFGLVIEHDQVTCIATELSGEQIFYLKRRITDHKASDVLAQAQTMLAAAVEQSPSDGYAVGVGVSVSGFFAGEESQTIISRNDVDGWREIDIEKQLQTPVPMPVFVENDGRTAAIGQAVGGIGRNLDSFFLILMTKGVGGGFVNKGSLVRGRHGNAGEVPSFFPKTPTVKRPTKEALNRFLREKWGMEPTESDIDAALERKDEALEEWISMVVETLNPVLDAITRLLDPQAIILAGRLNPSIRRELAARVEIEGISYLNFSAEVPDVLVDPRTDGLSVGACALAVAAFLYS